MPHVTVKLWPGRSDGMKRALAEKLAKDVAEGLHVDIGDVSVAFEEVAQSDWKEKVYKKEICDNTQNLYFKPDYEYDESCMEDE